MDRSASPSPLINQILYLLCDTYTIVCRLGSFSKRAFTAEPVLPSWFDEILHKCPKGTSYIIYTPVYIRATHYIIDGNLLEHC